MSEEKSMAFGPCGVVVHGDGVNANALLKHFAQEQAALGYRVLGLVARRVSMGEPRSGGVLLHDFLDGESVPVSPGCDDGSARNAVEPSSLALRRVLGRHIDLLVVTEFGEWNEGESVLPDAIRAVAGVPVLASLHQRQMDHWGAVAGELGAPMIIDSMVLPLWWRQVRAGRGAFPAEPVFSGETVRPKTRTASR